MKKIIYLFLICFLLCPSTAMAFFTWESSPSDKSIEFLTYLFGAVGDVLLPLDPNSVSSIFGVLSNLFNIALLAMGSIVMTYVIWISAIETAQEGEVLGRQWSAAWIPIRAMIGVGLLLPTSTGYSFSQIAMMWVVVNSVHAANVMWTVVLENFEMGSVFDIDTQATTPDVHGASDAAQSMFKSLICMEMANEIYVNAGSNLGGEVTIYEAGGAILVGVQDNSLHSDVCGGLVPSHAVSDYDPIIWNNYQITAADGAASFLYDYAEEAVLSNNVTGSDIIMSARKIISNIVASTPKTSGPIDLDEQKENAKKDGWLYVGSYYVHMATWRTTLNAKNLTAPGLININYDELPFGKDELLTKYNKYLKESDLTDVDEDSSSKLALDRPRGLSGGVGDFWESAGLSEFFIDMAMSFIEHMNDLDTDPLIAMQKLGGQLMTSIEVMVFVVIIAAVVVSSFACLVLSLLPFCWMITTVFAILIPAILMCLMLLWSAGATLGIYVPLIPFLIYTFSAISWFLLVIEAMVAAPVAALGLTDPSAENFGNIGPVMNLSLALFLRPILMVIGFIAAERALKVIMHMINFGFEAAVSSSLVGVGLFGAIALIVLYVGIAMMTVQECFSLIHILPDRVIRWIGGQSEQSNVGQNLQESQSYLNKGASAGESMMKGGMQLAGQVNNSAAEKAAKKGDAEEGDAGEGGAGEGGAGGGEAAGGGEVAGGGEAKGA